ncbi:MAG: GNAT family N-acetyltransferase [Devosia sp.]
MGLNYTAVDQDVDVTRRRVGSGTCYLAVDGTGGICGTIVLHAPVAGERPSHAVLLELQQSRDGAVWLKQPGIAHFGQFAVDPDLQGQGLGARLLDTVETQARFLNAKEIALDTAEPAVHLVALYARRGYRHIGFAQWSGKTYRSVIMSKGLF